MTPREYINALKAEHPRKSLRAADLPETIGVLADRTGSSREDLATSHNEGDYAENLLALLMPRLPAQIRQLFESGDLAVGTVESDARQIYVKKVDEGFAIVYHRGLAQLIYRITRILATRFLPNGTNVRPPGAIGETAQWVADALWWLRETGRSFGPSYPIEHEQLIIASQLTLEAGTFLIAHEIGHVLAEGAEPSEFGIDLGKSSSESHQDEHLADVIGLRLVMNRTDRDPGRQAFNTSLTYAGAELALQIYHALEMLGFDVDSTSHPPAYKRLKRIRTEMRSLCDSDATWEAVNSFASAVDSFFAQIVAIIQESSEGEHALIFEREAAGVLEELDSLLARCVGGAVPDYATFAEGAARIMGRGYTHLVLASVSKLAAEVLQENAEIKSGKATWDEERVRRIQKFKLLIGYSDRQSEPVRSMFFGALGIQHLDT